MFTLAKTTRLSLLLALTWAPAALAQTPTPTVQLQTWVTAWDQDQDVQADTAGYGDPEHDPGISIRRARIGLEGQREWLSYRIRFGPDAPYDALERSEELVGLVDAEAEGAWTMGPGTLKVSLGSSKVPFSREQLVSSSDLVFQERGVSSAWLAPGRELGAVADYELDQGLRIRAGVFNGQNSLFGDNNVGMLGVGRVEWSNGDTYTTRGGAEDNAVGVGISALYDADVSTNTLGLAADAYARLGHLTLLAEVEQNKLSPGDSTITQPDVLADTTWRGFMAQASWYVPLDHGGIDAAARFSVLDDAKGSQDNGDVGILHVGASWRDPIPGLDLGLGFIHRQELQGRSLANDSVRLWAQVVFPARAWTPEEVVVVEPEPILEPPPPEPEPAVDWRPDFEGSWTSGGALAGAVIELSSTDDGLMGGTFMATEPLGRAEVGRAYELEPAARTEEGALLLRIDPHGDGTDVVWFELAPDEGGELCGWGYEDGRRDDTIQGLGGGAWVCWAVYEPPAPEPTTTEPDPDADPNTETDDQPE